MNSRTRLRNTVQRTVVLYRGFTASDNRGYEALDYNAACIAVDQLDHSADRYINSDADGTDVTAWLNATADRDRVVMAKIDRTVIPIQERDGLRAQLRIAAGTGIAQIVHVRFFPRNVIGFLYNDDGPRPTKLREILRKCGGIFERFDMTPLVEEDALRRLGELEQINLLEVAVNLNEYGPGRDLDFMQAIAGDATTGGGQLLRISISGGPGSFQGHWITDRIGRLLQAPLRALRVRGKSRVSGRSETFDLQHLTMTFRGIDVRINRRNRSLDDNDAFAAIERAYNNNRERIPMVGIYEP